MCSAMRWTSVARKKTSFIFDPRVASTSSFSRRSAAMMSALATSTTKGIAPYNPDPQINIHPEKAVKRKSP